MSRTIFAAKTIALSWRNLGVGVDVPMKKEERKER